MSKIAVVGSGQLAQMMAQSKAAEGHDFYFIAGPNEDTRCVDGLGTVVRQQYGQSAEALFNELNHPDVITVEKEHVDCDLLTELNQFTQVHPNPDFLRIAKDRAMEKDFLAEHDIPVVPYRVVKEHSELYEAINAVGYPVIVKSTQGGYDGQNQWSLSEDSDIEKTKLNECPINELVVEKRIKFDLEFSIIAARNTKGEIKVYPLALNHHRNGVLLTSIAPFKQLPDELAQQAEQISRHVLESQNYVGVLSIEFFLSENQIYVNEMAPRVHNSGHWTMDGAETSQFANHVHAILGEELGSTEITKPVGMINLLGVAPDLSQFRDYEMSAYDYNKTIRPGRKMGHLNFIFSEQVDEGVLEKLTDLIYK